MPALRGVVPKFGQHGSDALWSQAECAANRCRFEVAKRFPGSLRVPDDARWYALSDLYGGGSQMDEPLNEPGLRQTN